MPVTDNPKAGAVKNGNADASVSIGDTRYDLPVRKGSLGADVIDISALYQDTGCFSYDPGFTSTASCESKIIPHLDFYSAITLKALGFPTEMFTVVYAIARTAGWIAHWKEMIEDPSQRIGRPRQLYTGATELTYVPVELRH
jgi:citrate synthase